MSRQRKQRAVGDRSGCRSLRDADRMASGTAGAVESLKPSPESGCLRGLEAVAEDVLATGRACARVARRIIGIGARPALVAIEHTIAIAIDGTPPGSVRKQRVRHRHSGIRKRLETCEGLRLSAQAVRNEPVADWYR